MNNLFEMTTDSTTTQEETLILAEFLQRAERAHHGTSFDPEKRGKQMIRDYSEELTANIDLFKSKGVEPELIEKYIYRYKSFFANWLNARSGILSAMITGPSGYPARQQEKKRRSEDRHYTIFKEFREKSMTAIIKTTAPKPLPLNEEIERLKRQVVKDNETKTHIKALNVIIKKHFGNNEVLRPLLLDYFAKNNLEKLSRSSNVDSLLERDYAGRIGFASFVLTNLGANIKYNEKRIAELEQRENRIQETKENPDSLTYEFEGGNVFVNYPDNRIQITHDVKPSEEVRSALKRKAFKWSPTNQVWQRFITADSINAVNELFKTNIPLHLQQSAKY